MVFASEASNLVPDDTNSDVDVFLYDAVADHTILISRAETGELGQSDSEAPRISHDGRFVTFIGGLGLDPEDTNLYADAFVYEIATGELEIVSTAHDGTPSDGRPSHGDQRRRTIRRVHVGLDRSARRA